MSEMAKAARAAMKAKASRLGKTSYEKVDASSWTPAEPLNADKKTGMRPLTRRAFKKGGKVVGKCEGGPAKKRADRKQRKAGGRSLVTDLINRNDKKANEAREGGKSHVGALKSGGRAHRLYGGGFEQRRGTPLPYNVMKKGGRARRADGGPLTDASGSSSLYMDDQSTGNAARDLARMARAKMADNPSMNPGNVGTGYTPVSYSDMAFDAARDAARAKFEAGSGPSSFAWKGREYGLDAAAPAAAAAPARRAPAIESARRGAKDLEAEAARLADLNAAPQTEPPMQGAPSTLDAEAFSRANAAPASGRSTVRERYQAAMAQPSRDLGTMIMDMFRSRSGEPAAPSAPGWFGMGGLPRTRKAQAEAAAAGAPSPEMRDLAAAQTAGFKRGGKVSDEAQDKKMIKKAIAQHDKHMHGGKHEEIKLKKGGYAKRQAGGAAEPTYEDWKSLQTGKGPAEGQGDKTSAPGGTMMPRDKKKAGGGTYFGGTRPTGGRMPKANGGETDTGDTQFERTKRQTKKTFPNVTKFTPEGHPDWEAMGVKGVSRMPRKSGGRAKGKTNIIIAINPQQGGQQMPGATQGPTPKPTAPMPVAPPGMPGGAPVPGMAPGAGAPPGMPPGMPPMPPGMPPMARKHGGRAYRSYKDMDAGAMSGKGRLEKTEIEGGKRRGRLSGGRARSYKDMDAGSMSGMGRIEKTAIQKHRR